MHVLLALVPIALIVALLLGTRVSAASAGWAGFAAALALALAVFDFPALELGGVAAEALFTAATILWILLPALAVHELQTRTGALDTLRGALSGAVPDAPGKVLLVGWFFALFVEGAAGFGTPLAIAAPMLAALGLAPAPAVAAALLGHVGGVAFGAVGTPVLAQAELSAAPIAEITRYTALLVLPLAWVPAVFVLHASHALDLRQAALATVLFCAPFAAVALVLGPELPTLAGALAGGLAFVGFARRGARRAAAVDSKTLLCAAAPYLGVIALILLTRLVPPLKAAAMSVELAWSLPGDYSGALRPFYHPGTLLVGALLLGAWVQRAAPKDLAGAFGAAGRRLAPAVLALVAMLALSRLMLHSGMIAELARAAVQAFGGAWPAVAPAVGALGSFVTGSATASNVLFTSLQDQAARSLDLPVAFVLAAQTTGAALGNAICPHNIIAGAAAVGAAGREGEILRRTLPVTAAMIAAAGLFAWSAVRFL